MSIATGTKPASIRRGGLLHAQNQMKEEVTVLEQLNCQRIRCDECGVAGPSTYSAHETRATAHNLGWHYPPRTLKSGKRSTARSMDLCPTCAETFAIAEYGLQS